MFARLRLHRFISGNDQQHQINASSAGQHVFHKPLMPWDVHEAEAHVAPLEKREAKVNRDTASLFFFEPIRVRSRQRFDERGFSVVNVAGCADDNVLHIHEEMRDAIKEGC